MEITTLNPEEKQKIDEVAELEKITVVITSMEQYQTAGEWLKKVSKKAKEIEEIRLEKTRPLDKLKKDWTEFFAPAIDRLKIVKDKLSKEIYRYEQEQQRIREEQERKLRDQQAKEEEKLRKKAEDEAMKGNTARAAEAQRKIDEIKSNPVFIAPMEKVKGVGTRDNWKFRVIDNFKLDRQWLCADEKKLSDFAKATKGEIKVDGVEFYNDPTTYGTGR